MIDTTIHGEVMTNFEPYIGKKYHSTRTLILSESAYSWQGQDGKIVDPASSHPTENLRYWGIDHFRKPGYYMAMGRAICGVKEPTPDQLKRTWNEYAYTIFVQGTVGFGAQKRPTDKQFKASCTPFLQILEKIRPLRVIVTGKTMWNHYMPSCTGPHLCDDLQAYKLSDGILVWCLAVPHPSSRGKNEGFQWERVGRAIRAFKSAKFPIRES
jgi:hypothetical protein